MKPPQPSSPPPPPVALTHEPSSESRTAPFLRCNAMPSQQLPNLTPVRRRSSSSLPCFNPPSLLPPSCRRRRLHHVPKSPLLSLSSPLSLPNHSRASTAKHRPCPARRSLPSLAVDLFSSQTSFAAAPPPRRPISLCPGRFGSPSHNLALSPLPSFRPHQPRRHQAALQAAIATQLPLFVQLIIISQAVLSAIWVQATAKVKEERH